MARKVGNIQSRRRDSAKKTPWECSKKVMVTRWPKRHNTSQIGNSVFLVPCPCCEGMLPLPKLLDACARRKDQETNKCLCKL